MKWFRKVGPEPRDGSCCSVAQIASGCDGAKPFSLWRAKNPVNNFSLDKGAQEGNILGSFKQVDQPITGVEKTDRSLANGNPTRLNGSFQLRQLFPANDLSYGRHIKLKKQGEQRDLFRCLHDLTFSGDVDRRQEE